MHILLGHLLPLALVVAVSPVAAFGVIRMTISSAPGSSPDLGFALGWLIGVVSATSLSALLVAGVTSPLEGSGPWVVRGIVLVALGLFSLVLAGRRWRARVMPGHATRWPEWVRTADTADAAKASGLGFALGGLDLKNLTMSVAAGVLVATSGLSFGEVAIAVGAFAVLTALAVLFVVVGYRSAAKGIVPRLRALADGLEQYLGGIEPAVLVVGAGLLLGLGVASF